MPQLNPIISPTQDDIVRAQQEAISEAQRLADTITGVSGPEQALIREILPDADLGTTPTNTWADTDREWVQSGLTADQVEDVYDIDSNTEAQDKVLVFYGVFNTADDVLTTEVTFQDGTGATFARFNTEPLNIVEISDVLLFDELIVYGSTEDGTVNQWVDADGTDQMVYLAKIAEPLGQTLATREPTERRLAGRGGR